MLARKKRSKWKTVDPLPRFRRELLSMGATEDESSTHKMQSARQVIDEAVEFAKNSPLPGLETLYEGTYARS